MVSSYNQSSPEDIKPKRICIGPQDNIKVLKTKGDRLLKIEALEIQLGSGFRV